MIVNKVISAELYLCERRSRYIQRYRPLGTHPGRSMQDNVSNAAKMESWCRWVSVYRHLRMKLRTINTASRVRPRQIANCGCLDTYPRYECPYLLHSLSRAGLGYLTSVPDDNTAG